MYDSTSRMRYNFSDLIDFSDNQLLILCLAFLKYWSDSIMGYRTFVLIQTGQGRRLMPLATSIGGCTRNDRWAILISHKKFGIMTGRTFLLVLSLPSEISRWFSSDPKVVLADVFRMEGISKCFNGLEQRSEMQWVHPMADIKEPAYLEVRLLIRELIAVSCKELSIFTKDSTTFNLVRHHLRIRKKSRNTMCFCSSICAIGWSTRTIVRHINGHGKVTKIPTRLVVIYGRKLIYQVVYC